MRLLHFVAIGTFCQGRLREEVVGTPCAGTALGMSSLWIRHCNTPYVRPWSGHRPAWQGRSSKISNIYFSRLTYTQPENTHIMQRHRRVPTEPLLFLEPVLLQPSEGSQSWVAGMGLAAALFMIQARATGGAQSAAIALADYFHGQG